MPELPEVETVVRDLRPVIVGQTITAIEHGPHSLRRPWLETWTPSTVHQTITAINRRGKWIILELGGGSRVIVHLGMTGQFTAVDPTTPRPDHLHFNFLLTDYELRFRDIRRFGSIEWFTDETQARAMLEDKLGPEPFDIPALPFAKAVQASGRKLKAILLDQAIIAGIGNIYADESLHRARLHPETLGSALSTKEISRLREAIEEVMLAAVEGRGSTIRDYVGGSGLRGEFQDEFRAYGRTGEPCPTCTTPIERLVVAGRSSHFCPKCQKR
ncbi:MAG: bifunctional DNA-formamidopyrimidine glycosylase/DNA-(apurinic or apyrimidinic site) lyase [Fimbriiglobus sp.]